MSERNEFLDGPPGDPGPAGPTYEEAVKFACEHAGAEEIGWNKRFREGLALMGLCLLEAGWGGRDRDSDYPDGIPYPAPIPQHKDADAWPVGAVIVYEEAAANTRAG